MSLRNCLRHFCHATSLVCAFSLPVFAQTPTNHSADTGALSEVNDASRHFMFGASTVDLFGLQFDAQLKVSSNWSVGLQFFDYPDIFSSILSGKNVEIKGYGISGRYYINHHFSHSGLYVSPTVFTSFTETDEDKNFNWDVYALSAGYQWSIGQRFGVDLSVGVLANLFGNVDKDESRFAEIYSLGLNLFF